MPTEPVSDYAASVGAKLKALREDVRKMSPEDLEKKVEQLGGKATASYIRRVEKGLIVPTLDRLNFMVRALGSNLGLFFEDEIAESTNWDDQDRRYHRILQRRLDNKTERKGLEHLMFLLDRKD